MKTCPNCNVQLDDAATFCANCGARISESAQAQPQYTQNTAVPPQGDPYDHTAEFTRGIFPTTRFLPCSVIFSAR